MDQSIFVEDFHLNIPAPGKERHAKPHIEFAIIQHQLILCCGSGRGGRGGGGLLFLMALEEFRSCVFHHPQKPLIHDWRLVAPNMRAIKIIDAPSIEIINGKSVS
jgi:hypothetical protein